MTNPNATPGTVSSFLRHHFRHFNAAALIDAADGYKAHLDQGGAMMITLAGAMSTAELGLSLAEMIRQDKVQIITCTGSSRTTSTSACRTTATSPRRTSRRYSSAT